jgi:sugar/nucleoside kinase (ribokinase family)
VSAPDFVAVGHVTLDRFGAALRPGGAALYAAVTADRLGLSVGLLTSHGDDFPLDLIPPRIEVVTVPAEETTRFEHDERDGARVMTVTAAAQPIGAADIPADWAAAPIALLAPVIDEVDPLCASAFTDAAVAAAAQGWLRQVGPGGVVIPRAWESPRGVLARLHALFLSSEDVLGQEPLVMEWFQHVPVGVLTAGRAGALLFVNGYRYEVAPWPANEIDPTGAGDVFAASFLASYNLEGDPWDAAATAACAAALSVQGEGWSTVPDRAALEATVSQYRRRAS